MADENTVEIGGKTLPIQLPKSFALRSEVLASGASNWRRAMAAALGICCPKLRLKTRYELNDYNPLRFGGSVLDELVERGIPAEEVYAAGGACFSMLAEATLEVDEVERAEGNSEAP